MSAVASHNPTWVLFVRIAQIVLSIILLGLAAGIGAGYDLGDAPALVVASAVLTWVAVAYILLTQMVAPLRQGYHLYAVIGVDALLVILWLCAWALSAARAGQLQKAENDFNDLYDFCSDGSCFFKRDVEKRDLKYKSVKGLMGACAGLGALIWILFILTLVLNVLGLMRGSPVQASSDESHQMEEAKPQPVQPTPQTDVQGQPIQPQYTGQEQQQQQYVQPQYTGQEQQQQYVQPQYTGQEQQQQYIQPQHTGQETYTQHAPAAPGEVQYPAVAPPAPHN